jgi:hypothetical protein
VHQDGEEMVLWVQLFPGKPFIRRLPDRIIRKLEQHCLPGTKVLGVDDA